MYIKQTSIEQLKAEMDIVKVADHYCSDLKKKGKNHIGKCPLPTHDERTGSFSASPQKGIYKCFGCGSGGDAIKLVMEMESCSFYESMPILAGIMGFQLEYDNNLSKAEQEAYRIQAELRSSTQAVMDFALKFYQQATIPKEWQKRQFSQETMEAFSVGYAKDSWDNFLNAALEKGFDLKTLISSGMVNQSEGEKRVNTYDFFRNRILFPITDIHGRILHFSGRTLSTEEKVPKYINGTDTPIYKKDNSLLGIAQAKAHIIKEKFVYYVEGAPNVLRLHQEGKKNVVASLGTSLTNNHIKLIKRFCTKVVYIPDNDNKVDKDGNKQNSGFKAMEKNAPLFIKNGFTVEFLTVPPGSDVDDFLRDSTDDQKAWFSSAKDFITNKVELTAEQKNKNERAQQIDDCVKLVNSIPDKTLRSVYEEELKSKIPECRFIAKSLSDEESPTNTPNGLFISDQLELEQQSNGKVFRIFLTFGIKGNLQETILNQLPIINITSTNDWFIDEYSSKPNKQLQELFNNIKPEALFLLMPPECLNKKWRDGYDYFLHAHKWKKIAKEIYTSSIGINSVKRFYIKTFKYRVASNVKSFLDYAIQMGDEEINKELKNIKDASDFSHLELTDSESQTIKEELDNLFGCGTPDQCYRVFKEQIGTNKFTYRNIYYRYQRGEVKRLKHMHADRFIKIRDKFIYVNRKTLRNGIRSTELTKYDKSELQYNYGASFLNEIERYDDVILEPLRPDEYKRTIHKTIDHQTYKYYNIYEPLSIVPAEEATPNDFPHILNYIKHITQGEVSLDDKPIRGQKFSIMMDWLRIAYRYPKAKLPMVILVSKERGTGKSTLLALLQQIFGDNSTVTNMSDLLGKFNAHNGHKTMVCLEEVKMEGDKDVHMDRLKDMITGFSLYLEPKGLPKFQISNYARYVAVSNHEHNIMKIDEVTEDRFFVMKVPSLEGKRDPDFQDKMFKEIPQFLRYLLDSDITHSKKLTNGEFKGEGRLWFSQETLKTEEFHKINQHSKTFLEKDITEYIKDIFLTYLIPEFRSCPKIIYKFIRDFGSYRYSVNQIQKYLTEKMGAMHGSSNIEHPVSIQMDDNGYPYVEYYMEFDKKANKDKKPIQRYYKFIAEDWLSEEELASIKDKTLEQSVLEIDQQDLIEVTKNNLPDAIYTFLEGQGINDEWKEIGYLFKVFNSRISNNIDFGDFRKQLINIEFANTNKFRLVLDCKPTNITKKSKLHLTTPF